MAKCNKCGLESADDLCGRTPCPNCGATTRTVEENVAFGVAASDHAMLELRLEKKTIAFRESERDGRITAADEENGKITTAVTGSSPQGETDTLNVCRTLVRKLDGTWGEPIEWTEQNSDIDCVSKNTADENDVLYIQVIRAIVDDTWWHTLASSGTNTKSGTADE